MNRFLKENSKGLLLVLLIVIVYFVLRLPNLTLQPIFADEAIYIRWAQVMRAEPTLRFVSLTDGKTPLFMWVMIPFFKVFSDPLAAGRIVSVLSGFITLSGVLFLGYKFFGSRVALWAAFLYAITPYFVFFDRMALVDSMLSAFTIWTLNFGLLLVKFPRIDLAMGLGYLLGGGLITKTPGFFNFLGVFLATIPVFNYSAHERSKRVVKTFLAFCLSIGIGISIFNILRLGPGFSSLNSRNQDYVRSPLDLLVRPWDPFLPHFYDLVDWFPKLLGIPLLIVLGYGIFIVLKQKNKIGWATLLFSLVPLFIQMCLLKTFTARYLLFSLPPLIVIAGIGIDQILASKFKKWAWLMILILALWPLYFNFYLLTNPEKAPLSNNERHGYLEEWTAGYGLRDIAVYLNEQTQKNHIVVGTEGAFGTLPDGLQIYFDKNLNISFVTGKATVSADLRVAATEHPTFFVANKSRYFRYQENLKLIKEYPKAISKSGSQDFMLLFEVLADPIKESTKSSKVN